MSTILVTPRGYAKYGQEAAKKLESLGYEMDINDTGKPVPREVFIEKSTINKNQYLTKIK